MHFALLVPAFASPPLTHVVVAPKLLMASLSSSTNARPPACLQVIGGIGAMDSIVTVDPDPATDLKHVSAGARQGQGRRG